MAHRAGVSVVIALALLASLLCVSHALLISSEKTALMELYDAMSGARWNVRSGWDTPSSDPCLNGWHGVQCFNDHVTCVPVCIL
jgi:hypothetical protein